MTAEKLLYLAYGFVIGIGVIILVANNRETGYREDIKYLQERRTTDSLTIKQLRKQLLYAGTLVVETTYVDGSIVKQRYCKGDSVLKVW